LELVRALHRASFFPEILKDLQADHEDALTWETAISIAGPKEKEQLSRLVSDQIQGHWSVMSGSSKHALLNAASALKTRISAAKLKELLSDPSYEARIASAHLAGELLRSTGDEAYSDTLLAALQGQPYQLRLETIEQIRNEPALKRAKFRKSLSRCEKDPNSTVRNACKAARKDPSSW
jgi:hypothetical protein